MLKIHETLLELIRDVGPTVGVIARQDKDLASQIRRALSSAVMNVSEGGDQRGARRASHYSIAFGSSREALTGLRAAAAWGFVGDLPPTAGRFDKIHATLYRVLHSR